MNDLILQPSFYGDVESGDDVADVHHSHSRRQSA